MSAVLELQRRFRIRAARRKVREATAILDRLLIECPIDSEVVSLRGELLEVDRYMTDLSREDR